MAMSGDLFGCPVSDLVPKSTEVTSLHQEPELRFGIQQQLAALVCVKTTLIKYFTPCYFYDTLINWVVG